MMLQNRVDRFKVASQNPLVINFRCPLCGDSKKSKSKARGFLFKVPDGGTVFKCHNCGQGKTLRGLLKIIDHPLYTEYAAEYIREDPSKRPMQPKVDRFRTPLESVIKQPTVPPSLIRLNSLPGDHPARVYWHDRGLGDDHASDAWWCPSYYAWINSCVIEGKFSATAIRHDCGRIVFPFRSTTGAINAYTGRSIGNEEPKYVAIRVTDEISAFGMDRADLSKTVYVLEGPIDSLLVPNAVAMGTSNRSVNIPDRVMVYDNQPRNEEIVKIMSKTIDAGEKIVIWPQDVGEKDVNEMLAAGRDPVSIIKSRTFSGMRARIEFGSWRRC